MPRISLSLLILLLSVLLPAPSTALYSARSDVVQVTEENFKEKVLKAEGVVLVEFYAAWCGHCKNLVPEWDKAATALKGVVTVAAVDASVAQSLAQKYDVKGFPTIKVFGAEKGKPVDYQGGRTAKDIVNEGLAAARSLVKGRLNGGGGGGSSGRREGGSGRGGREGEVVTLSEADFKAKVVESKDLWLVAFIAPWCGYCKKLEPEWKEAASRLKGQAKLGLVDATVHTNLAGQFDVKGYPSIKMFAAGKKKGMRDYTDYQGPRESAGIVDFTLSWLEAHGAPPEVHQLLDSREYEDACSGPIICLLAALPHLLDTGKSGREAYLTTLLEVAKKNRKGPFRLFWTEGGAQPAAEEALGLTFGFPAVAALSKEKGVFATFKGSFNAESITSFLVGLTTGKEVTAPLPGGKLVVVPASAWDGKEAVVVEEEEFSLEDIMGEEL